ncbi:MAG: WD40/YVTN/BNR-like repeat-containing protein, partial [Desulfatibacillaceae bacterium]
MKRFVLQIALLLLAACVLAPLGHAAPDVESVSHVPTVNDIFDSWTPDGVTFYFVGDAGTILRYDGQTFTHMETPTQFPLFCIHGTSETDIWAAGGNDYAEDPADRAVILHYDGTSWIEVPPLVYFDTTYPLDDIHAVSANNVWAVDEHSAALFHYDGTQWELSYVPAQLSGGFAAIHAFAADDIYAAGSWGQIVHWDGSAWSLQLQLDSPDSTISTNLFFDVWGPDADNVFVSGNYGQVWKLNKQTGGWEQIGTNLGSGGSGSGVVLTSIAGASPATMVFSSSSGDLFTYNGATFTQVPPTDSWEQHVVRLNADGNWLVAGWSGRIEEYDGANWDRISRIPDNRNELEYTSWGGGDLWFALRVADADKGAWMWDGGRMTERPFPISAQGWVTGFRAFAKDDVWAGLLPMANDYSFGIFRWDGTQWNAWKPTNYGVYYPFSDVLRASGGETFIIMGDFSGGQPGRLVDDSVTDTYQDLDNAYLRLAEGTDGSIYAVGTGGAIVAWRDSAWEMETSGITTDFVDVAAGGGYVVAVAGDRKAVYKADGGNWQAVSGITERADNDFAGVTHVGGGVFIAILNTPPGFFGANRAEVYRIEQGVATRIAGWISPLLQGITVT